MSDLISREVVIGAVKRLSLGETDATRLAMRIGDYLKRVPSAQPERTKGRWIDDTYCDQCGWTNEVEPGFIGSVKGFNFCPNCGADMREDQ